LQYHPERITQPLVRRDGQFVAVTWDEALDLIAGTLARIRAESGPEAVLHYRSGGSLGIVKTVNDWFFECFGGARVKKGDICSGAGEAAQEADLGISEAHALDDLLESRIIVLWGKNVVTSFVHMLPVLKAARARGTPVILIDPMPTRTARFADLVLQPRPGCDRFLALGVAREIYAHEWVDPTLETWSRDAAGFRTLALSRPTAAWAAAADVPLAGVERLAEMYATLRPGNIQVGWGLGRRLHGAATVRVIDALAALTGNYGVSGGGVTFYYRRRAAFDVERYKAPPARRGLLEATLGAEIEAATDPPVRAVVIDNGNPVAMLPDSQGVARALRSREFVVVLDHQMTDTARCADVVLPVTTMLEETDVVGAFGHHYLGATTPVATRPEAARSDLEIYQALAERLGFADAMAGTARQWAERLLRPVADRVRFEELQQRATQNPLAARVLFEGKRFATPDGRYHFVTEVDVELPAEDAEFPLQLGSFSTPKAQSSQWSEAWDGSPLEAHCHPDASPVPDGGVCWLASRIARLQVTVRHDAAMRRDLVAVPKGGWMMHGRAANALVRARLTDHGLAAAYYDEGVRFELEPPLVLSPAGSRGGRE
jgi:anaerobic selenocysteine-containing dehydrogenase